MPTEKVKEEAKRLMPQMMARLKKFPDPLPVILVHRANLWKGHFNHKLFRV